MTKKPTAFMAHPASDAKLTIAKTDHSLLDDTNKEHPPHPTVEAVTQRCLVGVERLKRYSQPHLLPTDTRTAPDLDIGFGQPRALKALQTALDIKASGYHVFAAGENGLGKQTIIKRLLQQIAADAPTPDDWIYVHNFANPRLPLPLRLPAGQGILLQQQTQLLWQQGSKRLGQRFRSQHYHNQIAAIKQATPQKEATAAFVHDEHVLAETFALEQQEDKIHEAIDTHHQGIAKRALQPLFAPIYQQFADNPQITDYLNRLFDDMVSHVEHIVNADDGFIAPILATTPSRYAVNVLVSHEPESGAPIIFEDLPTHLNLLGHVEKTIQLGTVTTDISMIRAGALHRANGGYLLLEASHVLEHPYAWQGLKRALRFRNIKLSCLEEMLTAAGGLSLAPQPIELDIKVILLGEADLYYQLLELEPEFDAIFKIRADFQDDVTRTPDHELALVGKMADIIEFAQLYPFNNEAQATLLEHLSLQAEDQDRLSLHSDRLIKLLHESNRHAQRDNLAIVDGNHVAQAIADMDERSGYLRDLYWHELKTGQQLIVTQGNAIGQINALTVVSYADSEFGIPARLTAVVQPNIGTGDVLDIERDVELGGSLHAKGMLIMTSYLRALFSQHHALNFSASIAFEQSYANIDGDSATVTEACALLSALANVPINQALAITGSMNQLGKVQSVGGINAKIIGFFDACREQTLTGQQGVVIPMANVNQLMLRDDIIDAVDAGLFHIYGVNTLSEALTLMTGLPIDTINKKGRYRKYTLFGKVLQRLMLWDANQDDEEATDDKKTKKKAKKKRPKKSASTHHNSDT